ncbi:hypothetical protein Y032_0028g1709 [Ancylostoma ceylanicum]|uniref:ThiS family protein n=1 Tax=Ancylostoma ceylanicum TaxID=53326 RepID=A0A016URW8_9BILA|nr:hypothetical protein Y032_0028g1709 [Ancylostoma ceylanicum]
MRGDFANRGQRLKFTLCAKLARILCGDLFTGKNKLHMEPDRVKVRLLFFAKARELMEREEEMVYLPSISTCRELKDLIFNVMFNKLACIEYACALAVDLKYVRNHDEVRLLPNSQVAVIPPLCGG